MHYSLAIPEKFKYCCTRSHAGEEFLFCGPDVGLLGEQDPAWMIGNRSQDCFLLWRVQPQYKEEGSAPTDAEAEGFVCFYHLSFVYVFKCPSRGKAPSH